MSEAEETKVEESQPEGSPENGAVEEESKEEKTEEKADSEANEKEEKVEADEKTDGEKEAAKCPEPDKKLFKEQFILFSKFGDKTSDGKCIKLSQSDKWFKQAKVIDGKKVSTTDTGIAFRKISKNSPKLSFVEWNKYLDEIANNKKMDVNKIKTDLVNCGKPGFSGATSVVKSSAVDRLTDTSRYGGTHKQRFDSAGKGKGKAGREEVSKKDGYVTGFKQA